jgi:hypothetical protein
MMSNDLGAIGSGEGRGVTEESTETKETTGPVREPREYLQKRMDHTGRPSGAGGTIREETRSREVPGN